jgi:hypothetical protein
MTPSDLASSEPVFTSPHTTTRGLESFGDFEIVGKLGQGGMGAVYRARQRTLDRLVALKILPSQFEEDADYVGRFQREAKVAASLNHPNLVRVYACGVNEGCHYIAMELVEGENLHQRIRRGALPAPEALRICLDVARGLQCGWQSAQLIHRDIKPSNIYLSSSGEVKLGDLGLAKSLLGNTTGLTQTGSLMGTPHYISPEQARGDKTIDFRADIYSLGCTLFEMLTGRTPYEASDTFAIVNMHLNAPPPALMKALPGCPIPLARVVGKMLKKSARERQQSYEDLIAELERVLEVIVQGNAGPSAVVAAWRDLNEGRPAPAAPAVDRPAEPVKSKLPLYITIAATVLVLGALAFIALRPAKPDRGVRQLAAAVEERGLPRGADQPQQAAPPQSGSELPQSKAPAAEPWQDVLRDPAMLGLKGAVEHTAEGLRFNDVGSAFLRPQALGHTGAIRLRATFGAGRLRLSDWARQASDAKTTATYVLSVIDEQRVRLSGGENGTGKTIGQRDFALSKPLQAGQDYELELRAAGGIYTAKLNGQVLGTITGSVHDLHQFGVAEDQGTQPALVKSLEVLDLDAPAASTTPRGSEPWIDGLAEWWAAHGKENDVLHWLAQEAAGSRCVNGQSPSTVEVGEKRRKEITDVALRATISGAKFWSLDLRTGNHNSRYSANVDAQRGRICLDPPEGAIEELKPFNLPPGFTPADRHTGEFRAQGDTLTFLLDGQEVASVRDTRRPLGGAYLVASPGALIEKLEYTELTKAPPPPAADPGWHDLLADVDLTRAVVKGTWKKVADGIELEKPDGPGVLEFNTLAPSDYEFEIQFTPTTGGNNVNQHLSMAGRTFVWKMNAHGRTPPLYGLDLLDGKFCSSFAEAAKTGNIQLEPGKRYVSSVKIHPGHVHAFMNGVDYLTWEGDPQRLSSEDALRLRDGQHLGLGSWSRGVIFHRAAVRQLLPGGKPGAAAEPAAAEPWQDVLRDPAKLAFGRSVERTEEGLRMGENSGASIRADAGPQRDGAVRIRTIYGGMGAGVRVRNSSAGNYQLYASSENVISLVCNKPNQSQGLANFRPKKPLQSGQEYELELRIVGQLLTARLDGEVLGTFSDGSLREGLFGVATVGKSAPVLIKSLEVLDLDAPGGASATPAAATRDAPFVNSLGMKFVPVPIVGGPSDGQRVLFSVWETRVQDYEVFVQETQHEWPKPGLPQGPTHPAVNVSWDDAQAFCDWLSARDHEAGKLGPNDRYWLPTDHEWSCAVGIGEKEDAAKLPSEESGHIGNAYLWGGTQWPPPAGAGNYASDELQPLQAAGRYPGVKLMMPGYRDGFAETAPAGSFPPNGLGLYDLGGNVSEWCEDWYDAAQTHRVLRGASWTHSTGYDLRSSTRDRRIPVTRDVFRGFRVVLAPAP